MAKTLLDIVQDILVEIDGEPVNSIFDTEESEQIARIVIGAYNALMSNTTWQHTRRAIQVTPHSDSSRPTHMIMQEEIKELISVYYDSAKNGDTAIRYKECEYIGPEDFLRRTNKRSSDKADTITVTDPGGVTLLIKNNKAPEFFTTFNDKDLVFDSYDSEVDSTLQESKTQALAYVMPTLSLQDASVPDLPPDAFTVLIEEATSRVQYKLRDFEDRKSEQEATRQRRFMSRKSWRAGGGIQYPNYGKRRRG